MSIAGWLQIILVLALVVAAALPLAGYIVRVLAGEQNFLSPVLAPVERGFYRLAGVDARKEQGWLAYTMAMLDLQPLPSPRSLRDAAVAEPSAARSARLRSGGARSRLQHLDELRHQHQLAELRGRDDAHPFRADARPDGAQLPVAGGRPRHGGRAGARLHSLGGEDHRQFLGRYDPRGALCDAAARDRGGARARRARRAADLARLGRRDDARRRQADDLARARSRPRRRSRSSARMAAASSTPIRPIPSRIRTPGRTSSRIGACSSSRSRPCSPSGACSAMRAKAAASSGRWPSSSIVGVVAVYWAEVLRQPHPDGARRSILRPATWKARRCASARR